MSLESWRCRKWLPIKNGISRRVKCSKKSLEKKRWQWIFIALRWLAQQVLVTACLCKTFFSCVLLNHMKMTCFRDSSKPLSTCPQSTMNWIFPLNLRLGQNEGFASTAMIQRLGPMPCEPTLLATNPNIPNHPRLDYDATLLGHTIDVHQASKGPSSVLPGQLGKSSSRYTIWKEVISSRTLLFHVAGKGTSLWPLFPGASSSMTLMTHLSIFVGQCHRNGGVRQGSSQTTVL